MRTKADVEADLAYWQMRSEDPEKGRLTQEQILERVQKYQTELAGYVDA